jgi:hypothetical protein
MTGLEWQVCTDSQLMIETLHKRGGVRDRQWRLFVAAFWRWKAELLGESREEVLENAAVMEQFAESGKLPRFLRVSQMAGRVFFAADAVESARLTAGYARHEERAQDRKVQSDLLRDLFDNPFRTIAINNRWRTADVIDLTRAVYEDRAFERMPILADALMDAGCEDERLIGHCRSDARHVRGCWALDLLLQPSHVETRPATGER